MKESLFRELRLVYSTKEQSQDGKRLTYLDMARGIAIIMVVIGHSGFIGTSFNIWISLFHLPTFFLISGILLGLKQEESRPFRTLALQKFRGIMIPYLWFSLGSVCIDILQVFLGKFTWDTVWEHTFMTITFQGYSVLWFLPVLYLAELFLILLLKAVRSFSIGPLYRCIITIIITTFFALGAYYGYQFLLANPSVANWLPYLRIPAKALMGAAFMSYGYGLSYLLSCPKAQHNKWLIGVAGALLASVNFIVLAKVGLMDLNNLNLYNPVTYLLLGTTGGMGCILLCKSLPNIPPITFWGQNSLIIMCTHMNFYVMYFSMLFNLFLVPRLPGGNDTMYAVFSIAGTFVLSIAVIVFIRAYLPFVLGRKTSFKTTKADR